MATVTATPTTTGPTPYKFTAEAYHRLAEVGILKPDDRVELIEGQIIVMAPVGDPHVNAVDRLNEVFVIAVAGKARVSVQNPVRLSQRSEPEPDLLILRRESFGRAGRTEDVLALVEVSDTTLRYDRDTKLPLYARHAIPHVLNVDMTGGAIVHYFEPEDGHYRQRTRYVRGDTFTLEILPSVSVSINVDDLFT
ncbi:MAG TPA: Uma2 family endonuclease [Thermomicrobiales bacterium]|nr:Uma2 family endonuclease [Thermomicrobiales bacterium]